MNKSDEQNTTSSAAKTASQSQKGGPYKNAPTFTKIKPLIASDPGETAQEADHEITRRDEDEVNPPLAAKGNDDVMSQQQQQNMPTSIDAAKGKWKQQLGAAKIAWGKLTEDELLRLEGHEQKLAGLVQERYAITRDEADKQVKAFFDKNKS